MADNQGNPIAPIIYEIDPHDGAETFRSSHRTQRVAAVVARDWGTLIQTSEDERTLLAVL